MQIQLKLSKDFESCLGDLKKKYGEAFEYINGLHDSQLDFSEFIDNFVAKSTLADSSIDPNANANHKDIRSFMTEKGKSEDKLFGLNKIFNTIKKQWGLRTAREWLEQEYSRGFYLNDSATSSYFPYCFAVDLSRLATEGLFFLDKYNNEPPRHLTTFLDDVIEFVSFLSNRQSGACGLPNIIVWSWYFWKKDCEDGYFMKDHEYYLRQQFQKLLFRLNQPFLRIDQSAFTNVSIFDHPYLEALFGGVVFPDGTMAIDHIDDIIECEKVFMDVVSETREINMFTYPVLTFSLLYKDGQFIDEEFARYASAHNMKWSDSNFFVSDNVGVLSNCPVSGDTNVVYWDAAEGKFDIATMRALYGMKRDDPLFKINVLNHGDVVECNINKYSVPIEYEIELANGVRVKTTANHLNRIYDGDDTRTDMLSLDDYLPFSAVPYIAPGSDFENGVNLEFKDGKALGVSIGLNYQYDGVDLRALNHSPQFRRGTLEGLALATSGKRNEIVTTSIFLRDSVTTLIASIGFLPMVGAESVGMVAGSAEPVARYHISWRKPSRENYEEGVYFCEGDSFWVRVKSIRKLNGDDKQSYCLNVIDRDADPVFMLANGLHTHNCRLLSDTTKLDAFINSIGGTALSVGSCRVSTINLVRIAYESGLDKEKYIQILKDRVLLDCKALTSMRHIIKRNIEKGLLPNFQDGALELDKMFCTIGGM